MTYSNRMTTLVAATALIAAAGLLLAQPGGAKQQKQLSGEAIFNSSCAQCHQGGGNKVHPHKPAAGSEKLATLGVFKSYLQSPIGHMPYYDYIVKDKATLKALYDYVKKLPKPTQT